MKNQILEKAFTVWAYSLTAIFCCAFAYTIWSLATGNYCSTASFEF